MTNPITYFASGTNHSGEIRALSLVPGANIGTVAKRLCGGATYEAAMSEVLRFSAGDIFIDSGAFEEVKFPGGVPTIVKPLGAAHWDMVFSVYEKVTKAHAYERGVYVVAPDCIAHQEESLERFERYAERCIDLWELGACVLVPIQKGALSMADYAARVDELMDGAAWIPSIPMKKDATTLDELVAFVEAVHPSAIHLLGLGVDNKAAAGVFAALRAIVPGIQISCDSCLATRWAGRKNGPKNGPRCYTRFGDHFADRVQGLEGHTDTHVRKVLSFYFAARHFWADNGLCSIEELVRLNGLPREVEFDLHDGAPSDAPVADHLEDIEPGYESLHRALEYQRAHLDPNS